MANKKYTDFAAGTYDTAKIFLQADATTGDLEKINLPTIPSITGLAHGAAAAVNANNSGSNPQTLVTVVIPHALIDANNACIDFWAVWQYITGSGSKTTRFDLNTVAGGTFTTTGTNAGVTHIQLVRLNSTTVMFSFYNLNNNAVSGNITPTTRTINTGTDITIDFVVTGGIANDIKFHNWHYTTM